MWVRYKFLSGSMIYLDMRPPGDYPVHMYGTSFSSSLAVPKGSEWTGLTVTW